MMAGYQKEHTVTRIYRLQPVQYDRRTGIIDPIGRSYAAPHDVAAIAQAGYVIVEPLVGWDQYTHLLATPGDDGDGEGAPYFLARFVAGEGPADTA